MSANSFSFMPRASRSERMRAPSFARASSWIFMTTKHFLELLMCQQKLLCKQYFLVYQTIVTPADMR